tara:strand:- start:899 stop:1261 length:363 start_codon:yes stop_codon:yes gene_type:complete
MKHLLPDTTTQTISIIPRIYATNVTLTLRDDSSNVLTTTLFSAVRSGNYLNMSGVFTLKEGGFYDLKIYNGQGAITESDLIYRDKVFCTAQSTNQTSNEHYTVNKNEYVSKSGNNDFIIL